MQSEFSAETANFLLKLQYRFPLLHDEEGTIFPTTTFSFKLGSAFRSVWKLTTLTSLFRKKQITPSVPAKIEKE